MKWYNRHLDVDNAYLYGDLEWRLYLANCTRPDLMFSVTRLTQFSSNPGRRYWQAAKHVLRYLHGSINLSLVYRRTDSNDVCAYSDADWASDIDDRRSNSGTAITIGHSLVIWKTCKQKCVSLSTMEAEYLALPQTTKEAVWIATILKELKFLSNFAFPLIIHCDNRSAIDFSKNNVENNRSKHIDIRYHHVRERIISGEIKIVYIPTKENLADVFTKTLSKVAHKNACDFMNCSPVQSFSGGMMREAWTQDKVDILLSPNIKSVDEWVTPSIPDSHEPGLIERPDIWFHQVEAQFLINNIKTENTKLNYLIAQLDPKYVENLWDIITSKEINKYSEAKERLLRIFKDGESKIIRKLLSGIELGDLKPSQLLQKLRSLATEDLSVKFIKTLWLEGHPSMLYQDYQVCYTRTTTYAIPGVPSMLYQEYQVCYTRSTKYAIPGVPSMLYQEYQVCYTRRTKCAIPGEPSVLYQENQVCYTRRTKCAIPGEPSVLYQEYQVCYTRRTKCAIPGEPRMFHKENQVCYTSSGDPCSREDPIGPSSKPQPAKPKVRFELPKETRSGRRIKPPSRYNESIGRDFRHWKGSDVGDM
ncbi:hypothetical protein LAZ67_3003492 [Cordylochernes scorpioides]|uniref:DUF7041 domain-containing protein n=1 Tax=Cordylochernes scorpioides TaxID=51811 RepID=A0ABY6K945_9ARAC|nr:hypothetical protein LAZ67_3003492 [Cordylochernes scorpioides]